MKTRFLVSGWLNGADYDGGKPADAVITVTAPDQARAEDLGDQRIARQIGKCEVIDSEILPD
jgi:hypothetical protein